MYSERSKFETPLTASKPLRFFELVLTGTFSAPILASSAVVTHGGFPTTRSGPFVFHLTVRPISTRRMSALRTVTFVWDVERFGGAPTNRSPCTSIPTTPRGGSRCWVRAWMNAPSPHVGSRTRVHFEPIGPSVARMSRASSMGVGKSPNSSREWTGEGGAPRDVVPDPFHRHSIRSSLPARPQWQSNRHPARGHPNGSEAALHIAPTVRTIQGSLGRVSHAGTGRRRPG